MPLFTYDDTVQVKGGAPPHLRPGLPASVVAISRVEDRHGDFLQRFPEGIVYTIEFEGGDTVQVQEFLLERGAFPSEIP